MNEPHTIPNSGATYGHIYWLVRTMWSAPISTLRKRAEVFGPVNPVGDGDMKTATPSTYRPVGSTCPDGSEDHIGSCPYLGHGCYAQGGNVALHMRRASEERDSSIRSVALAMVWARRTARLARLHVSGDFVSDGRIDHRYIAQIGMCADVVNDASGQPRGSAVAWSYTHIKAATFEPYRAYLARKGVHVRLSDTRGAHGAIVADFNTLPAMKAKGVRYIKCPAQLPQEKTCVECTLCWTMPDHTIVFEPHGAAKRRAREASLRVVQ